MSVEAATRAYDAQRKREQRARESNVEIGSPKNVARRRESEADPFLWLPTYCPDAFDQPFTDNRREMVEAIVYAGSYGFDQAIAAPRGEGKTTITEKCLLYLLLTGRVKFVALFAATGQKAVDLLDNIKLEFIENEILAEDYPEVADPVRDLKGAPQRANTQTHNGEPLLMKWGQDYVRLPTIDGFAGSGSRVKCFGLDGAIRGVKKGDSRPDLAVIDDPETEESADSEYQVEKRERVINRAIKGLRGGGKKMSVVMLTTVQNRRCLSYRYTDPAIASGWGGKRQKYFNSWPANRELWQDYMDQRKADQRAGDPSARTAHQFYIDNREQMDAGADVSNPHRFESQQLPDGTQKEASAIQHAFNIIADGDTGTTDGMAYFLTEYQNDPPEENEPTTSDITARVVRERVNGHDQAVIPVGAKHLVAMVDVGKRRLHYTIAAWSPEGPEGWVVDYGERLTPQPDVIGAEAAIRQALDELADTFDENPYHTADGAAVPISTALVDCGNWNTVVYDFVRARGKPWQPSMGDARFRMPTKRTRDKKPGKGGRWYESRQRQSVWVVNFDPDYWKHKAHDLLTIERGLSLFGENPHHHREYAEQVVAEVWTEETLERPTGKVTRRYFRKVSPNNHQLDCLVGCCVAGAMHGVFGSGKPARTSTQKRRRKRAVAEDSPSEQPQGMFEMLGPGTRPSVRPKTRRRSK